MPYDRFVLGRAVLLLAGLFLMAGCTSTVTVYVTPTPRPTVQARNPDGAIESLPPLVLSEGASFDDPQLAIILVDRIPFSVEGPDAYFVEVRGMDGARIVNWPIDLRGGGTVLRLPPGDDVVTAYFRGCGADACTQFMGPRVDICSTLARLDNGHRYTVLMSRQRSHCALRQVD